MNIAIMSHDHKKELMVQFCIAYCGVLSKHTVCATNTTGRLVAEATGLPVRLFLSHAHGGSQQIGARIAYNEIDMVLFFSDPQSSDLDPDLKYINQMCDQYNIPFARHQRRHRGDPEPRSGAGRFGVERDHQSVAEARHSVTFGMGLIGCAVY